MQVSRRILLGVGGLALAGGVGSPVLRRAGVGGFVTPAAAQNTPVSRDPRMADRTMGSATAPVTVIEFYSLTCPHCAVFSANTLPQLKQKLVDTGKLRIIFRDFPLDQLALTASAIARTLPPDRYEPFCAALLASQDRWAFARGINNTEELAKLAALAGLPRETFNKAIVDQGLKDEILEQMAADQKGYNIDSTPSFVFNGPGAKNVMVSGDRSYDDFAKLVTQAAG
jgi:protein-disulfide isomerase